ncbi:MAG TPA: NAD-dependent epimerase/dehydratase family protein [Solirubrobacteraceae bacterium]
MRAYLRGRPLVAQVFVTGGTGVIGRALVGRLMERGDEVVALARSDASAQALADRGARVIRGEAWDEDALAAGMSGCAVAFNLAGVNSLCVADPVPMQRANIDGAVAAVRAASRAGLPRLVHTSSAATIGEANGVLATESTPHRGSYLSTYERTKTEGERAAMVAAAALRQDVVYVNPSSVQGPGRAGGTGRFLLAFLDGRLKVFVNTHVSLVDIADCIEGHLLAAERGVAGERYLLSGIRLTITEALALAADVAGVQRRPRLVPRSVATVAGTGVELAFRVRGRQPPVCREMVRTLLHGHRYDGSRAERELGLTYTPARETLRRTVEWARAEGLLRNV